MAHMDGSCDIRMAQMRERERQKKRKKRERESERAKESARETYGWLM